MLKKIPTLFYYLLGGILVLNILQAYFTELIFDEAYYWYYAENLAWGYFDHPPMVAWLITISSFFFTGELGVRFTSCLLSVGTLFILWTIIDHSKKKDYVAHFFVVAFSMTLLNAYGFLTLPDTPLLFFTALFLLIYKRFIVTPTLALAIMLGFVTAAIMYSKYNAVLVIIFILLSNLKLLKNKYAWLTVIIALVCYIPHFIWLFDNDFVTIKYHLFDRPNEPYDFNKFTLIYFLNLIAIFGLTFPVAYYILFKTKPKDLFERALVFLTYGVLIFFFISSFSKRVQPQWVVVICIPMVLLIFNYILEDKKARKWFYRLGLINIVILLYLRVWLVHAPLLPMVYETHGNKKWVSRLQYDMWDIPVVFENSYRYASMYQFYSDRKAISLNNILYRKNQYSIDNSEASLQHKRVFYVTPYTPKAGFAYPMHKGKLFYGEFINDFESFRKLECIVESEALPYNLDNTYEMKLYNPYQVDIPLSKLKFGVAYSNESKQVSDNRGIFAEPTDSLQTIIKANDTLNFVFKLSKTKIVDPRYFKLGVSENNLRFGLNGKNIKLE